MPTSHFVTGPPGHVVEVGTFDGRQVNGQGWCTCTCGWTRQDILFTLTCRGAEAHVREAEAQAKTDRQATAE